VDNPPWHARLAVLGGSVRTKARIGLNGRRCLTHLTAIVAAATIAHGSSAWGQCSNDAGAGDTPEGEICPADFYDDTTNGGCNSSTPAFTDVAADGGLPRTYCASVANYNRTTTCTVDDDCPDGNCDVGTGLCLGVNEPAVNQRDTDWYRLSAAELAAGDTDGNGTVRINSAVTGEAGLDLVTFFLTVDTPDCIASVQNSIGCWNGTGSGDNANFPLGQTVAEDVFIVSENPFGIIVFVAPGRCSGAGVFDGYECSTGLNDYTVSIAVDPVFEAGDFTACGDPAQNPQLLPCCQANPGVNGCDDPECCALVCEEAIPQCCFHELGWIQQCADAAIDVGCAPECGGSGPICLATGLDPSADGYCSICADPYGSWSSDTFGGAGGAAGPGRAGGVIHERVLLLPA